MAAREPIVISATVAAKQAALLHGVVEKNVTSRDLKKRDFAAEVACTLSFWAQNIGQAVCIPRHHRERGS